jgi:hypothetical protein
MDVILKKNGKRVTVRDSFGKTYIRLGLASPIPPAEPVGEVASMSPPPAADPPAPAEAPVPETPAPEAPAPELEPAASEPAAPVRRGCYGRRDLRAED